MSQHLPEPRRPGDFWTRLSADPRVSPNVRASDADRDVAADVINRAYAEGRLDSSEHADRLDSALRARQLGELVPLLDDIAPVAGAVASGRPGTPARSRRIREGSLRSWLALAVLFNAIWLATWLFSGSGPYYYWPIWPMLGTGIPVLMAWAFGGRRRPGPEIEGRSPGR